MTEASRGRARPRGGLERPPVPGTDLRLPEPPDSRNDRTRLAERFLHPDHLDEAEAELPEVGRGSVTETTFVVCPGLIGAMLPLRAFEHTLPVLDSEDGLAIICADAHPMRDCSV